MRRRDEHEVALSRSNGTTTSKVWKVCLSLKIAYCPCSLCVVDHRANASELSSSTLSPISCDHVLAVPSFHFAGDTVLDKSAKRVCRVMSVLVMKQLAWSMDCYSTFLQLIVQDMFRDPLVLNDCPSVHRFVRDFCSDADSLQASLIIVVRPESCFGDSTAASSELIVDV